LGKSSIRRIPTSTKTVSSTQTAKVTTTYTPITTTSIALTTSEVSVVTFFDYFWTTTDFGTTLESTTLTLTPTSYTSTTTVYSIVTGTQTTYTTIATPNNWLPIQDTTASAYPQKREIAHPHARRANPSGPAAAADAKAKYPQSVKCTQSNLVTVVNTRTVTASTTSTVTVQPTAYSYFTVTQYATTTVYPASTTVTVTGSNTVFQVSVTTQVATLSATLAQPTYAACALENALTSITFANGTTGAPIAPASMGDGTSLFIVSSFGGLNVDCCAECWATPGCAGAYTQSTAVGPSACYIFVDEAVAAGTCRQRDVFGAYQWEKPISVQMNNGPFETLWNGQCGYMYLGGWNGK
jgi:hypothetical protein